MTSSDINVLQLAIGLKNSNVPEVAQLASAYVNLFESYIEVLDKQHLNNYRQDEEEIE